MQTSSPVRSLANAQSKFKLTAVLLAWVFLAAGCSKTTSDHHMHQSENGEPVNYLVYDDQFASAGMPDAAFIKTLASQGVDIVVNVAPHTASRALENEAALVEASTMTYLNIPVDWNNPTQDNVEQFLAFMRSHPEANVFLHCQMNMRATAFAMLHRVINLDVDPDQALADMHTIWTPNKTWADLMNTTFENHGLSYRVSASKD